MEKIIITPLLGMGDTLMTTPALELLKTYHPNCSVTFFTFNEVNRLVMYNNPYIDTLWSYPIQATHFLKGLYHILKHFTFRYDTCLNFYPSNRNLYNLFALLTAARDRIGHTYQHVNFSQLNWLKNKTVHEDPEIHCVEENIRLLKFFNIEIPNTATIPPLRIYLTESEKKTGAAIRKSIKAKQVVGVHVGTSTFKGAAKRRWPKDNFVKLINQLPDIHFILFGAYDEIQVNYYIQEQVKNSNQVTLLYDKTIRDVAAVIGTLDAFVSNDSGLMHMACAMQTPVVAILGPTNRKYIYPWTTKHEIVSLDLPCSPCFYYSPRPLQCSLNNSFQCIKELDSERVAHGLRKILS